MPQPVGPRVEGWRAATPLTLSPPVGGLIILLRNGADNPAATQVGAGGTGAVGLAGQHPIGPRAWPPRAQPRHPDPAQHRRELGAVTALAGGHHDRQRALAPSTARCSLQLSPPRERPSAWSWGSLSTPPGSSRWRSPRCGPRRRADEPGPPWSPR